MIKVMLAGLVLNHQLSVEEAEKIAEVMKNEAIPETVDGIVNRINELRISDLQVEEPLEQLPETTPEPIQEVPVEIPIKDESELPFLIRCQSDKVYWLEKRWVANPETLDKLGFTLADAKDVPEEYFYKLREGESIDLKDEAPNTPSQIY